MKASPSVIGAIIVFATGVLALVVASLAITGALDEAQKEPRATVPTITHVTVKLDGVVWECYWDDLAAFNWRCEEQDAKALDKK